MRPHGKLSHDRVGAASAARLIWIMLIVACGTCLSPFFACVTPFAALATLTALKFDRRTAMIVVGLVWAANQAIGYSFLHYPWTWDSAAWGLAIGLSAGLGIPAAAALATSRPAPLAVSRPFVAAFTVFELGIYAAGFVLPGSEDAFSASVVGHVFLINAVTLFGLVAVFHLAAGPRLFGGHQTADPRSIAAATR